VRARLAIVGAGTGVGKTHLGVALARALQGAGAVAALKPIESGVGRESVTDAAQLAAASTFHVKHQAPYTFAEPISPHLAARRSGVTIELARVTQWVDEAVCPWVIVETAGGLLSPIGPGLTNLDLTRALAPMVVILVALDRLGVLHEVAACALALRTLAPELRELAVILQAPEVPDLSTGTNAEELVALGTASYVFMLPREVATGARVAAAVEPLAAHVRSLAG
jgi:dethiobiotin synthetase